jgi:hypothetical protein
MKATKDVLYAAAMCLLVGAVFSAFYGRRGGVDWRTPVRYNGDTIPFLAQLKAARDGWVVPVAATFVPDLDAPFEANWNDYPQPQKTSFWLAGLAARRLGLAVTTNLLLLSAHVLAALSFFGVARYLRSRRCWAVAGGVIFACTPYIWFRQEAHLSLSLYWHVPLALLVTGWCFRRPGLPVRSWRFGLATFVAVVAALSNVYYAAMFLSLLGLAALAHAGRRAFRRMAAPIALIAVTLGVAALESLGTLLYSRQHGANPSAVTRLYSDLETYSLRPMDLVMRRMMDGPASAMGEALASYLGLAALGGLGLLLVPAMRALFARRRIWIAPAVGAVLWIFTYSIVGGVNGFAGQLGFVLLRGTNRYSIWLTAIALLHLMVGLSRLRLSLAPVFASALTGLALLDQVPKPYSAENVERNQRRFEDDRRFAAELESHLPGGAGMVFMLPVVDYPEAGSIHHMDDYQHFRPYLFTSHVRYSYGGDKGRPREAWQREAEALPAAELIDRLERYGFGGIVLDRRGYEDMGQELLGRLAAVGRPITIDDRRQARVFVSLTPRGSERP